ncbi:N-acetylmuramoyl-L-alanine amidase [Caproicibacter sp.]|uniref:N-acetylmuramoyl-L-alanine amidase n=1 Tax=Caproicibacter sp. TaxID=2814884 RepID=UPI00398A145A
MRLKKLKIMLCLALTAAAVLGSAVEQASAAERNGIFTTRPTYSVPTYRVYLSPSCQTWNPYCDGSGSEELHMREVAFAMIPYLRQYGIGYVLASAQTGSRENQRNTIVSRVRQAEENRCDLYLAIHSNARDDGPKTNGTTIFYPSDSAQSLRFANLLKTNFIYPDKSAVSLDTNDALWEMYMPKMTHCLIETAYHDNPQDVAWIESNTDAIAQSLARCVALNEYIPVSVKMDKTAVSVKAGKTCELNSAVTLINGNVYDNRTSWSSCNSRVAVVQNGTVLGISKGCTTIQAKTGNGLTAQCLVTVT